MSGLAKAVIVCSVVAIVMVAVVAYGVANFKLEPNYNGHNPCPTSTTKNVTPFCP